MSIEVSLTLYNQADELQLCYFVFVLFKVSNLAAGIA